MACVTIRRAISCAIWMSGIVGSFYHSQKEKAVVGIVEVIAQAHPDSTTDDDRWECVDIKAVCPMKTPVTLEMIKANPRLSEMVLVRNSRPVGATGKRRRMGDHLWVGRSFLLG